MPVAIVGAAGAIGRSVTDAYHAAGLPVRLVGRTMAPLEAMRAPGDEVVIADVATAEGCRAALAGSQQAVYTLGLPYTKQAFAAYPGMMRLFIDAARSAGTSRLLLITNVYPYGRPITQLVPESHPRIPCSIKGQYRKEQEDILLAASSSGLETISLRLPDFYGPNIPGSLLDQVVKPALGGKAGNLLAPADRPHEFVFTPDVGPVVKRLLEHPGPVAGAYNFAGAGIITQRELATLIYKAAGREPKLRVAGPWMQALLGAFVPVLGELAEMRYLLETPVLLDDGKLLGLLPGIHKTSYEDGAHRTVAEQRRGHTAT